MTRLSCLSLLFAGAASAQSDEALAAPDFESARHAEAEARGAILDDVDAGYLCILLIRSGTCDVETASALLSSDISGTGLYLRASLAIVSGDTRSAHDLLSLAADKGHPEANLALGLRALDANEPATAERHLRAAVEAGSSEANYRLGLAMITGDVLKENHYEGSFRIEAAAEADHAGATLLLGRLFRYGSGVRRDLAAAESHFIRAAELGLSEGWYEAAATILDRPSPMRDEEKLVLYAKRAHDAGHHLAAILLGDLALHRIGGGRRDARRWYQVAARSTNPDISQLALDRLRRSDAPTLADEMRGRTAETIQGEREAREILTVLGVVGVLTVVGAQSGGGGGSGTQENWSDSQGMLRFHEMAIEGMQGP